MFTVNHIILKLDEKDYKQLQSNLSTLFNVLIIRRLIETDISLLCISHLIVKIDTTKDRSIQHLRLTKSDDAFSW